MLKSDLEIEAVKLSGSEIVAHLYAHNQLREEDLLTCARAELFKGFEDCPRWRPIRYTELIHATATCIIDGKIVAFDIDQPCQAFARLVALIEATSMHPWIVRTGALVEIQQRSHSLMCPTCLRGIRRDSALVTIPWAGRILSREYAL